LSWNLSFVKRETENDYTTTAFSEDNPGTLGPFKFRLDRTDVLDNFNEIIPLITQSSVRFRSLLNISETPEGVKDKAAEVGQKIFFSLTQEIKDIVLSSRTLHIFTDDLELPWTLLHDGAEFVALKHPIGISSSKKKLHSDKSGISGKLRLLLIVDSKEDLPQVRFEIQRILHILSSKPNVEYLLLQGKDANYSNVRSVLQNDYFHIIHVSTHVVANRQANLHPGIVLNDDILTPEDIYHTIKSDPSWLVYMNACESSVSTGNKQNGLTDLATSFRGSNRLFVRFRHMINFPHL
jgi:CHAT domain-containing protein